MEGQQAGALAVLVVLLGPVFSEGYLGTAQMLCSEPGRHWRLSACIGLSWCALLEVRSCQPLFQFLPRWGKWCFVYHGICLSDQDAGNLLQAIKA